MAIIKFEFDTTQEMDLEEFKACIKAGEMRNYLFELRYNKLRGLTKGYLPQEMEDRITGLSKLKSEQAVEDVVRELLFDMVEHVASILYEDMPDVD